MTTFKCFWKIINKNKIGLLIYLGIFVGMSLLFSSFGANSEIQGFSLSSVDISIIDRDDSLISEALMDYLGEFHHLIQLEDEEEVLQDALFFRDIEYILIIPDGFAENFQNNSEISTLKNLKLPNSTSGVYIDQQIDNYFIILQTHLAAGFELETALENTRNDLENQVTVEIFEKDVVSTDSVSYYFQFLPYILISIIVLALGPIFMAFNKIDLASRINCSALSFKERNFQLIINCILCSFIIWLVFMVVPMVLYPEEMMTYSSLMRLINSLAFLIVCVAMAFLIGQNVKKSGILGAVTNVLGLGMSFITGVFVPQEFLGEGILSIARFLPSYWYIRSNDMLTTSVEMDIFLQGIVIQLIFAVIIFMIAFVIGKKKRQQLT